MRNKILQNQYNPYSEGRWYRLFIESDGTAHVITEYDIASVAITTGANSITFPLGFHCVDSIMDPVLVDNATAGTFNVLGNDADGCVVLTIPDVTAYTSAYIYVFGYFEDE